MIKDIGTLVEELTKVGKLIIVEPKEKYDDSKKNHEESMFYVAVQERNEIYIIAEGFGETLMEAIYDCISSYNVSIVKSKTIEISDNHISLAIKLEVAIQEYHKQVLQNGKNT